MRQTTLDGELARKALRKVAGVMMAREEKAAPAVYRDPDDPYFWELRKIAFEKLTTWFAEKRAPMPRDALIKAVRAEVKGRILRNRWPYPIPRWDTVRRRINDLCEEKYVGSPPWALAIEARIGGRVMTFYFPNPLKVKPEKRDELEQVIREWRWASRGKGRGEA